MAIKAKKAKKEKTEFKYSDVLKKLREEGPARVYMLWGEEDYLRDSFLAELRRLCVAEGTEAFNYHRLEGAALDMGALADEVDAMPFMGERSLVEVRGFDINKVSGYDPDAFKALVADVPDWATVAFVFSPGYAPDGHLKAVTAIKKAGVEIKFSAPSERDLIPWVHKRIESMGKRIDNTAASYLLWVCGTRMNTLIPEIVKIAGGAAGEEITRQDIDAVAKRTPETTIFNLTDALGAKQYDKAASLLADLLADKDEPPEKQIILISEQFRRLYAARIAKDFRLSDSYITDCVPDLEKRPYPLKLLRQACGNFSRKRLARAVELCAKCEFDMRDTRSTIQDRIKRMKELIIELALDA